MACLTAFANRSKLVVHLTRDGHSCLLNLMFWNVPLEREELDRQTAACVKEQKEARRRGRHPQHADRGALLAHGPLRPLFIGVGRSHRANDRRLRDELRHAHQVNHASAKVGHHARLLPASPRGCRRPVRALARLARRRLACKSRERGETAAASYYAPSWRCTRLASSPLCSSSSAWSIRSFPPWPLCSRAPLPASGGFVSATFQA